MLWVMHLQGVVGTLEWVWVVSTLLHSTWIYVCENMFSRDRTYIMSLDRSSNSQLIRAMAILVE